MSKPATDVVYPRSVKFHCTNCALCCGDTKTRIRHVLMLNRETETISKTTSKPIEAFACKVRGREPYVYEMRKTEAGRCVFLDKNACTIYASRPLICAFYPFQLEKRRKGKHVFSCTSECPGIGVGHILEKSYFESLLERARLQLYQSPV